MTLTRRCLDAGSTPATSTISTLYLWELLGENLASCSVFLMGVLWVRQADGRSEESHKNTNANDETFALAA